jgi:hypothetical protein
MENVPTGKHLSNSNQTVTTTARSRTPLSTEQEKGKTRVLLANPSRLASAAAMVKSVVSSSIAPIDLWVMTKSAKFSTFFSKTRTGWEKSF